MSVNDRIWTSLSQHGGGTINERVYNYLGSLGFTGTISDRLAKYTHSNKHGWQALIEGFGLPGSAGVLRQELFGDGQEGVMYVPQPTYLGQQVLYQDSAGTTPVTADGDPVGLMLDLSRGLVLGPELVTNGTFSNGATGWTFVVADWVIDGGVATSTSTDSSIGQSILSAGKPYSYSFDALSNGRYRVYVGSGGFTDIDVSDAPKRISGFGKSDSSSLWRVRNVLGDILTLDNVSVRELPGNHATAPSDAARPVSSDTPPLQVYDGVDDEMNVILPSIAAATVATATPAGVVIQYPVDLSGGSYTINESHSGIIIREGELTASEQQQVTDYLNQLPGV